MKQSLHQRDPNIFVSIDRGEIFEGTLREWEEAFGYLSAFSDDELVIYLYEWAETEGLEIKIMNSFQENFWLESLREAPLKILNQMFHHRKTAPEYQKIKYNQKVIDLIQIELKNRYR